MNYSTQRLSDRRFFALTALCIVALVFVGFSRTYYLKAFFHTPSLPPLLHIHAAVMTIWIVIFATEIALISARRIVWHRFLGWIGAVEAILVVVLGVMTTWHSAAREVQGHTAQIAPKIHVLALELAQITCFAIFVALAILLRRRPDYHKRFMLLATFCILANPIVRLPIPSESNLVFLELLVCFAGVFIALDILRRRRLHPAFGWGFAGFLVAMHVAYLLAYSQFWMRFAAQMLS